MEILKTDNNIFSFAFNDDIFNIVMSEIKNNGSSLIPQPIMIIGQEGAGKTTILQRIYNKCRDRHKIWIDGRSVFSTKDIIGSKYVTEDSLLFIDNIDYYFSRCSYDEQYKLRRILYNEGAPMMIATISKVLPAISEYEAPFFEGLKIVNIKPISKNQISGIFKNEYFYRACALFDLLPPTIKSIYTIFMVLASTESSNEDQKTLLSIFSHRYETLYKVQPSNSQHILNALSLSTAGMKIPEIRNSIGLKTSILTAYLKSLKKNGILSIDSSVKKSSIYSIKDPLFRLWLQNSSPINPR